MKTFRVISLAVLVLAGLSMSHASAEDSIRIERIESPAAKGSVAAVRITNAPLVHTIQILPETAANQETRSQSMAVLKMLDTVLSKSGSQRSDVVKLNAYVQSPMVREEFLKQLTDWSQGEKPAVTFVTTRLPDPKAQIAVDAVFVSRREKTAPLPTREIVSKKENGRWAQASILPVGDVVYISGQAQPGDLAKATKGTLDELHQTLKHLGLDKQHIVQIKCFVQPMKEIATVNREIAEFFGESVIPPVLHVEWISGSLPIEIELIAWAPPEKTEESVTYLTPPWMKSSPVFSRVARIHGNDRIYIAGLVSEKAGNGEQQVRSVFDELKRLLKSTNSDLKHLAKATYYVSDEEASKELNRLRPEYYDPQRPPAASKAVVSGVGVDDRGLTLDMIAAPAKRK